MARKKRADAGNNLINSDAKRRSRFTQEFVFSKFHRKEHPDEMLTNQQNNNQKLRYEKPNVEEVVKENLQRMTSSEVYTLFHELPQEHPWFNDVMDAFLALEASMEEDDE